MRVVPLSVPALTAVGASLLLAPAADAGWTTPRSLPYDGFSPAAASIDARGRGAVVGNTDTIPGPGRLRQPVVVTARLRRGTALGPPRPDLYALYASDLDVDAAGASVVAGGAQYPDTTSTAVVPQQIAVREAGAAFGTPFPPAPDARDASVRVARSARGDVAVGWLAADGAVHVQRRARDGATTPVAAVSAPNATGLRVAIGDDGTIAAAWIREGFAEVRVVEPDGAPGAAAVLGGGGTGTAPEIAVAAGAGGRVLAAASIVPAGQTAPQLVAIDRPGRGSFAAPKVLDASPLVDSPAVSVSGAERLVAWRRGNGGNLSYVRAAGRRGSKPLRPVRVPRVLGAKGVVNDREINAGVRAAVAGDGGAVVAFSYHSGVHAAVRAPGRRSFAAPRAVSALAGGALPAGFSTSVEAGRPLAVARGGRAILAFARPDGRPQVAVLRRSGRDRSTRRGAKPPVLRWGRPSIDLTTQPARISIPIDCDRACRTSFRFNIRGATGGSAIVTVRRVIPRKGSRTLVGPVSASADRVLRRSAGRRLRTTTVNASAATRYGGQVTERRTYRDLEVPVAPVPPPVAR